MMRALVVLSLVFALPASASETARATPRPVHLVLPQTGMDLVHPSTAPPATAAPAIGASATAAPAKAPPPSTARPKKDDPELTPATRAWRDEVKLLDERGLARGPDVAGRGVFGISIGGKDSANRIADMTPELQARIDTWDDRGALVLAVVPASPADVAGLRPGDVVVQLSGFWIDTPTTFVRMASRAEIDRQLQLLYLRDGQVEESWIAAIDREDMKKLVDP